MGNFIEQINNEIDSKSASLISLINTRVADIKLNGQNPSTGGSDDNSFAKSFTAFGWAFSVSGRKIGAVKSVPDNSKPAETIKQATECLSDEVAKEWKSFMISTKKRIQEAIDESELGAEQKEEAKSHTYVYSIVELTNKQVIDSINAIITDSNFLFRANCIVDSFALDATRAIEKTVKEQKEIYSKIDI